MFQRDYFMRMIEQMTEALGEVFGLRKQRKFEQAFDALDDLLHRLALPKREVLNRLSVAGIVELLSGRGFTETDKLYATAKVLFEEGELAGDAGRNEEAGALRRKAILVYAEAARIARSQRSEPPNMAEFEAMLSCAERTAWTAEEHVALALAFESYGCFASAEDRWFDALLICPEDAGLFEQGIQFYERLQRLAPGLLAEGGLPLEEVQDGLAEFSRLYGSGGTKGQREKI